ncbi:MULTISPECIES: IDEAL domain-containing protein [Bacillus]|uniref:IDEAL domain-containing protein n=1 Tax=Bacillus TaxID=1386 RepID=UPI000C865DE7|nr:MULTISPECIES: IDEAL domain-containing protein [Bacillus]KAF6603636.1 IDEAL domain-containing protein [Bacillus sp. EKM420B]KAF6608464.1 IDEAL domain-containing protein [Bacillus sp. EKM417B]MBA5709698.1 IDEAL domain-containing protein [Bacillus velezensis]MDV5127415.1 IDEAL domain-containing protein [Bacillus velezensis]MED4524462.1 IDEAL domain-containing protein [Bacillus velezensis]
MKEKKSYTELMKSRNTEKANEFDVTMADIYIQMVLDESLYKRRLAMLTMQINKALDDKNKEAFLTLSKEYAALKQSE